MKSGRFTRPKSGAPGKWSQGDSQTRSIPNWYCFICLPPGQGRDEESQVPTSAAKSSPTPVSGGIAILVAKDREKGLALAGPLLKELEGGITIATEDDYLHYDNLLGKIRNTRKVWGTIWEAIQERIIKPQREALDGAYSVNREIDKPLEEGEKIIKGELAAFKERERKQLEAANRERDRAAEELQRQIEQTEQQAAAARTAPMRAKLETRRQQLETQQQTVIEDVPTQVIGSASSTRDVKVLHVTNLRLLMAYLDTQDGDAIPLRLGIIEAAADVLRRSGKTQARRDEIGGWPGVELRTQIQIVGR